MGQPSSSFVPISSVVEPDSCVSYLISLLPWIIYIYSKGDNAAVLKPVELYSASTNVCHVLTPLHSPPLSPGNV